MLIYKCTNLINNKVYIGQTITSLNKRKSCHLCDAKSERYNSVFHSALRKYGKANFIWEVLHETSSINELNRLEIEEIFRYNSTNSLYGYNIESGGNNSPMSESTKRLLSNQRKGNALGKDNPFYGNHHSDEQKAKWSAERKGTNTGSDNYFYDKHYIGESNPFFGKAHSDKSKAKIASANSRSFRITDLITNKIFIIKNLRQFARDNNLNPGGLKSASRTGYIYKERYKIKKLS